MIYSTPFFQKSQDGGVSPALLDWNNGQGWKGEAGSLT